MRVIGVDPGLTRCGVGTVDALAGRRVQLVDVTVIRSSPQQDLVDRLAIIHNGVVDAITRHQPEVLAVERVFSQHNTRTAMGTAQASAAAILAAAQAGLPVVLHTPSEVKAAVTGNGRADKQQVAAMVMRLLHLSAAPSPADASDALALAICHAWRAPLSDRMRQSALRAKQVTS